MKRIPNAEGTAYPWWAILDPTTATKGGDIYGLASKIIGVFTSRQAAETELKNSRHNYGKKAVVYCFSGHASADWQGICNEEPRAHVETAIPDLKMKTQTPIEIRIMSVQVRHKMACDCPCCQGDPTVAEVWAEEKKLGIKTRGRAPRTP